VEADASCYFSFEAEADGVPADADEKKMEDEVDTEKTSEGTTVLAACKLQIQFMSVLLPVIVE